MPNSTQDLERIKKMDKEFEERYGITVNGILDKAHNMLPSAESYPDKSVLIPIQITRGLKNIYFTIEFEKVKVDSEHRAFFREMGYSLYKWIYKKAHTK